MTSVSIHEFKHWLKSHPNSQIRNVFFILKSIRNIELPTPRLVNQSLYQAHQLLTGVVSGSTRFLYWTPAFKGRLAHCGKRLYLYGGLPFVSGPLKIRIGDDCRISGHTTFSGCTMTSNPQLTVGNNVDIGWQSTIAVGTQVIIEDNVRIASGAFIFGYSGHPLDAKRRALGEGDDANQIGEIILRKDVWIGTNVTIKGGVTIGEGTVVAAGSVVTKTLPPHSIAAGNPARVIGSIPNTQYSSEHNSDINMKAYDLNGGSHA